MAQRNEQFGFVADEDFGFVPDAVDTVQSPESIKQAADKGYGYAVELGMPIVDVYNNFDEFQYVVDGPVDPTTNGARMNYPIQ